MEMLPLFQELRRQRCTFSTFYRCVRIHSLSLHHCRSYGRTLCHEHSSYHMAQTQYVSIGCYDCFNKSSSRGGVLVRVRLRVFRVIRTTFSEHKFGGSEWSCVIECMRGTKTRTCACKAGGCFCVSYYFADGTMYILVSINGNRGSPLLEYQKTAQPIPKPEKSESSTKKTTSNSSVVNDDEEAEYCHPTL